MQKFNIISTIGEEYLTSNTRNNEFSYVNAFKDNKLKFTLFDKNELQNLDLRFKKNNITIIVKIISNFYNSLEISKNQLSKYIQYEKKLTSNKIIAILANLNDDSVLVWRGVISDSDFISEEKKLKSFEKYEEFYIHKVNNKEKVMQNTYKLNELLHKYGISEKLRSQFVATCLLALKNNLNYDNSTTSKEIKVKVKKILENLLEKDLNKVDKLDLLNKNILESHDIYNLSLEDFKIILKTIEIDILPFINDKSTSGQDLLNLFFVTFNKYIGKLDKNQAFTPDHITKFMAKVTEINKNSVVIDPCCGLGSFLIKATIQALEDCVTLEEQENVKKKQIYGIEFDENIYALATTNMLIHSVSSSNIKKGSCFDFNSWITEIKPTVILMNPPYNAQKKHMPKSFSDTWKKGKKTDPTKGLIFVKYITEILNKNNISAKLAVLLPVACAIGTAKEISEIKKEILLKNTLDAVFTLPNEIFYPGASASVCCMIFNVGIRHDSISNPATFFGYYKDDGFKKKKNIGRIEQINLLTGESLWENLENEWLELYKNRQSIDGKSAVKKITCDDEWLCEAHMKTDYNTLTDRYFEKTIRDYYSYLIKDGGFIND